MESMLEFKNTHNNWVGGISKLLFGVSKYFQNYKTLLFLCVFLNGICVAQKKQQLSTQQPVVGANQISKYLHLLQHKKIGIVANQTSVLFKNSELSSYEHLVDSLQKQKITIVKVFTPEHGFRGSSDASEHIEDSKDLKTGLPLVSLYGKNRKPTDAQLKNVELVLFDIQDVGVRFYTYLSTLHYVMEACAENNIPVLVLDRPNPNGHYVDGPMMHPENKSFIGMHPVPLVYGMTIGEYAQMINGESWLKNGRTCDLTVIPLQKYKHQTRYQLPIRPSPNLPNAKAVNCYPSLGFFEGTPVNAGRGTEFQFQRYGAPDFPKGTFFYTPLPNFGSKYPKHRGQRCYGVDLSSSPRLSKINISWLADAYQKSPNKTLFFGKTFTKHVGNTELQKQLEAQKSPKEIEASWQKDLKAFQKIRQKYLLYD